MVSGFQKITVRVTKVIRVTAVKTYFFIHIKCKVTDKSSGAIFVLYIPTPKRYIPTPKSLK